jgi:hypothetical protein
MARFPEHLGGFPRQGRGIVGGGLTGLAALAQYRGIGSYAGPIASEDWQRDGDAWTLEAPYSRHGRRFPCPAVFVQSSTGALEEVSTGVEVDGSAQRTHKRRP